MSTSAFESKQGQLEMSAFQLLVYCGGKQFLEQQKRMGKKRQSGDNKIASLFQFECLG
jgi:hypothetical protein